MNDDELIEALRRTLHSQASSVRPSPSTAPARRARTVRATSPRRRTLLLASVSTAIAAATAAIVFAVTQSPQPSRITVNTAPSTGPNPTAATLPTSTSAPATSIPTPATTVPLPPVASGFQPLSITFVSARTGWALGSVPCTTGSCIGVARTSDGGAKWGAVGAPPVTLSTANLDGPAGVTIRFGDGYNGWIVLTDSQLHSTLWSSHDGGLTWRTVPNPDGASAIIYDLESSNDMAHLVAFAPGATAQRIYSTPVATDAWTAAAATIPNGGGSVPSSQIVLLGPAGWTASVNRIVTGGARLGPAGWTAWTPPCSKANGAVQLAAASETEVVATCQEGASGPSEPGTNPGQEWLYTSTDGGSTFTAVGSVPVQSPASIAVAAGMPQTIVAATANKLVGSFDGGKSWTTVAGATSGTFTFVGFTTATQGVAVEQTPGTTTSAAVITYDGGKTWAPINF